MSFIYSVAHIGLDIIASTTIDSHIAAENIAFPNKSANKVANPIVKELLHFVTTITSYLATIMQNTSTSI